MLKAQPVVIGLITQKLKKSTFLSLSNARICQSFKFRIRKAFIHIKACQSFKDDIIKFLFLDLFSEHVVYEVNFSA